MAGPSSAPQNPVELLAKSGVGSPLPAGEPPNNKSYTFNSFGEIVQLPVPHPPNTVVYRTSGGSGPFVFRPNWDGGVGVLGENPTQEDIRNAAKDASLAFGYLSLCTQLASFGVSEFAKNDFRNDIIAAKRKLDASQGALSSQINAVEQIAGRLSAMGGYIDETRADLDALKQAMLPQIAEMNSLSSLLSSLSSSLAAANNALASAEAQLAFARNRANFPPGIAGARAQQQAILAANNAVAAARTDINNLNRNISETTEDFLDVSNEYTGNQNRGMGMANSIISQQNQILALQETYANSLRALDGPLRQRSESVRDMLDAQKIYAEKLETAFALSQTTIGLRGAKDALAQIAAGRYYAATGEAVAGVGGAILPYVANNLVPYQSLLRKMILATGRGAESLPDWNSFASSVGEDMLKIASIGRMIEGLDDAARILDASDSYEETYRAWSSIVDHTGDGIGILGEYAEMASPFFTFGMPVGGMIRPATSIVRQGAGGVFQSAVTAGYLEAQGRLVSAPIGSRKISGPLMVIACPFALLMGIGSEIFGGPGTAELIRRMAETGSVELPPFRLDPGSVTLRPTEPGYFGLPIITGDSIPPE